MSKPIEPGCRAVIVGSKYNDGKIVTVGEYLGDVSGEIGGVRWIARDVWQVDISMKFVTSSGFEHHESISTGRVLQRIDDEDANTVISWNACLWQPDRVTANKGEI